MKTACRPSSLEFTQCSHSTLLALAAALPETAGAEGSSRAEGSLGLRGGRSVAQGEAVAAGIVAPVVDAALGVDQDRLDGLSVDCGRFWFNLRPSNTEPLLRLNLEAVDRNECEDRVADLLSLITQA